MAASLLSAAGSRTVFRAASGVVAKAVRGFQVFRIDGYSLTNHLPRGERITSPAFSVGGRAWYLDLYPNGCDRSKDSSDSVISLHLRLQLNRMHHHVQHKEEHVRAQYRFSLLDVAGNQAYELPDDTGVFVCPRRMQTYDYGVAIEDPEDPFCGYAEFIRREELERRRDSLLVDDRLAVRCDVAVVQLQPIYVAPKENNTSRQQHEDYSDWEEDGTPRETRRRRWQAPMDDSEYVRRCLTNNKAHRV